jgi:pimeloyl-ACP methyl ester carboxylesterase
MKRIRSPNGASVSYDQYGDGPPLVLIHGGFSDHATNWELVKRFFEKHFTVYAIARRGRGETDATVGHSLEDEGQDAAALIETVGEPVFLLGHSYGAHTALLAASLLAGSRLPRLVRKLVLYEPAWPHLLRERGLARLEALAGSGDWEAFAVSFFRDVLAVPPDELEEVRASELWPPIVADARASLGDLRAIDRYEFEPERFRELGMPVLLQIGSESPRDFYVTDALAAVLPDVRIGELARQAHEGMTTAPEMYAEAVTRFLLG